MRSLRLLLLPVLAASVTSAASVASAQTTSTAAKKPAATGAAAHPAAGKPAVTPGARLATNACVTVPALSPKIPALPAGSACPRALYTITTTSNAHLEVVSPMEPASLPDYLNIAPTSFTLAYVDIKVGTGPLAPPDQYYSLQYTGYLTDGSKFDSSYDHTPAEPLTILYGAHQVIPGWDTAFAGMHVGGKRRLFIPYQLAYQANGHPPQIPAKAELIFDVELISVSATPPPPPVQPAAPAQPAPGAAAAPSTPPAGAPATAPAANPTKP